MNPQVPESGVGSERLLGGRYELEQLLGQGGMAQVYRARDRVLGRSVAVKVLRPEYANDVSFVARFQREARAAANLVHPNIVSVYDVGQDGNQHYIVMEYIAGRTLKEWIRERAPLPVDMALRIAEEVCAALEYAHRHGIIHRDIKPQNILLDEDGEVVKVADFGIAKSRLDPESTADRLALGTVKYISPEQARGVEVVPQSDLYSLGVVLYEMLTGQQPFDGETPISIALQHLEAEPPPPRQVNPYIPPAVEAIVLRALAKDPRSRYASAREMRQALERYRLAGMETTGPLPQPIARPAPPPRIEGEIPLPGARPATRARHPPRALPTRRATLGPLGIALLILIAVGVVSLVLLLLRLLYPPAPPGPPTAAPTTAAPTQPATASPGIPVLLRDLTGLAAADARAILEQDGLVYVEGPARCDPYIEPGHVVGQEPRYGTRLLPGQPVTVTLSAPRTLARVPYVVQMSYEGARLTLLGACFRIERKEMGCTSTPVGYVARQEPRAGVSEAQGITVTVYVSIGNRETILPELLRVPLAEAQRRVEAAGLVWGYANPQTQADMPPGVDIDDQGAPGQVISYLVQYDEVRKTNGELAAGERVPCGAVVHVAYYAVP
ncbi:MAG: Stk1 family PASTA domain-containing Ser/Thr kinase [Chloroflexia bacterium]